MNRVKSVESYVAGLPERQREIAKTLRRAILSAQVHLEESIKWSQPVYASNGPVCYFKNHSKHVTFGFWRGASLVDIEPRLETTGSKMAHIKLISRADVDPGRIRKAVIAAVALNKKWGNPILSRSATYASRKSSNRADR